MSKMAGTKRDADAAQSKPAKRVRTEHNSSKNSAFTNATSTKGYSSSGTTVANKQKPVNDTHASRQQNIQTQDGKESFLNGTSSKEAHQKQKALRQERVAAKPNSDLIARSKKLWERLRLKSHVPKEERAELVAELFDIITGRVKDFVFKHDSVRVIQCALKYATISQKKQIAKELRGSYRELAESKYAKFLIAKMIVGDNETRDMIVPEFYGHVKRLIRHPEAGWILDDIYRTIATKEQKARLLREWYGPEFAVFLSGHDNDNVAADLSEILREAPAKRGPIMQHLKEMTNQLVQKKTTGFTILHDALLQYFLNCTQGTPEHADFIQMLKDEEDGDLFRNLAFTKSGSRIVCLALAYGNSKDRRTILKHFKTHIKLLAYDVFGHTVLLAAYEVIDDTVMTAKAIFPELLSKDLEQETREQEMVSMVTHLVGRIPFLYLQAPEPPKWLLDEPDNDLLDEVKRIRTMTSKKDPEKRRTELVEALSQPLLDLITNQASSLVQSSFGCQYIGEVLFGAIGEKEAAVNAVADLVDNKELTEMLSTPHAGRLLKSLVQGGRFNKSTNSVQLAEPPIDFHKALYHKLVAQDSLVSWASGSNSFTIVAMLEAPTFSEREELLRKLRDHRKELETVSSGSKQLAPGTRIILEKIAHQSTSTPKKDARDKKSRMKKEK